MRISAPFPWFLLAGLLAALALGVGGVPGSGGAQRARLEGRVVRVVDGDTVRVRLDGRAKDEPVRLIGVDTPESVKPGSPVECFGKSAAAFTRRELDGQRVRLERDAEERDRYGRLLAYVRRDRDGWFHNAELVRQGYAQPLTIPPNVRYASRLRDLSRAARRDGRGLWSRC
ncbi:thermonuclease family protein [Conexibacter sp. SYSU D00693]|uniref:thermonuclease family protein n=1 Tax=Conexibacter sp. SYSU D00693 TaxID=2812560 RepID=UPI00196BA1F9|nr:thermonuclease family protein [Conexibacter sp. SYSU D00693]